MNSSMKQNHNDFTRPQHAHRHTFSNLDPLPFMQRSSSDLPCLPVQCWDNVLEIVSSSDVAAAQAPPSYEQQVDQNTNFDFFALLDMADNNAAEPARANDAKHVDIYNIVRAVSPVVSDYEGRDSRIGQEIAYASNPRGESDLCSSVSDVDVCDFLEQVNFSEVDNYGAKSNEADDSHRSGPWHTKFVMLSKYKEVYGHCNIQPRKGRKQDRPEKGSELFSPTQYDALVLWIKRQRYQYQRKQKGLPNRLTDDRVRALEEIGFVWDIRGQSWESKFEELKEFVQKYGHADVPNIFPENPSLGLWVKYQRRQYKDNFEGKNQGRKKICGNSIMEQRFAMLEQLGLHWNLSGR